MAEERQQFSLTAKERQTIKIALAVLAKSMMRSRSKELPTGSIYKFRTEEIQLCDQLSARF